PIYYYTLSLHDALPIYRHVNVVGNFGHRPAVYLFRCSCRAVPGSDVELKCENVARVVEVHELLQALDVAIVEELLLEVRSWSLRDRKSTRLNSSHDQIS